MLTENQFALFDATQRECSKKAHDYLVMKSKQRLEQSEQRQMCFAMTVCALVLTYCLFIA